MVRQFLISLSLGSAMTFIMGLMLSSRTVRDELVDLWVKGVQHLESDRWPQTIELAYSLVEAIHRRKIVFFVGSAIYYAVFIFTATNLLFARGNQEIERLREELGLPPGWSPPGDNDAIDAGFALGLLGPFFALGWITISYVCWRVCGISVLL